MADYYPLIAKAVSGLAKSEDRRALYDRARTALLAQLRGVEPALSEPDITRERLALEEAIRKVEADAARTATRGSRSDAIAAPDSRREQDPHADGRAIDPPQAVAGSPPRYDLRPSRSTIAPEDGDDRSDMEETRQAVPLSAAAARPEAREVEEPRVRAARAPGSGGEAPRAERTQWNPAGPSPSSKGLFREAIVETDASASAAAAGGRNVRAQTAKDSASAPVESRPSIRTEARREPRVEQGPERPLPRRSSREVPRPPSSTTRQEDGRGRVQSFPRVVGADRALERVPEQPLLSAWSAPRTSNRIVAIVVMALLVLTLAGVAYWWGDDILASIRDASTRTADHAVPAEGGGQGKITERAPSAPGPTEGTMVAQKVVLVEEDQANPSGTPFAGSAVWRTERVPPAPGAPGQKPDIVVRGEIEIPEQNVSLRLSLRRNDDKQLPASHTVEIEFTLPPDFVHGGISHIPGIMMKQGETTRGVPLNGVAVKVTGNFFLIGLMADDMERNIQLLKERSWFDIPIVYGDGKRAIIAIEKGTPGERAFTEAFAQWGQ